MFRESPVPKLYHCRTSKSEVARLTGAAPPLPLWPSFFPGWSAEVWPGRKGLVVREYAMGRFCDPMRWGLPHAAGSPDANEPRPTAIWHRDLWRHDPALLGPAQRCLIILDSFTHADGPSGARTRTSYGYDDMPIFAWAGVWRQVGRKRGFAGILVSGADPVEAGAMPAIVPPDHYSTWLQAEVGMPGWNMWRDQNRELYREATEQPWARGTH